MKTEPRVMVKLPASQDIMNYYDETMRNIKGEYIFYRWGNTEVKERHYRQTELALKNALELIKPCGHVLEIGCGPAVWTHLFAGSAERLVLLDISEEMLKKARERVSSWSNGIYVDKTEYRCGDFLSLELDEAEFDFIVSVRAFEYMSDKRKAIRKCYSALKEKGRLLIVTKNRGWLDHILAMKADNNGPKENIPIEMAIQMGLVDWKGLMIMFREAGFRNVCTFPAVLGSYHRPLIWNPGLLLCDILHKYLSKRTISRMYNPLIESYLTIGEK